MDNEFYRELDNKSNSVSDRYKDCKVLENIETGEVLLSTRDIFDIPVNTNDNYHRVKSHEVTRLDILAHKYYRNPLLWWVIAQANDIYDPIEALEPGTLVRIPNIETLYGNEGILL